MYVYVLQITPVSCSTELDSSASAFNLLWFHMCWWGKLDLWKVGLSVDGKCFNFVKFLWKVLGWSSGFPSEYLESHCCSEQQQQKKKMIGTCSCFRSTAGEIFLLPLILLWCDSGLLSTFAWHLFLSPLPCGLISGEATCIYKGYLVLKGNG